MNSGLLVPLSVVETTLRELRDAGARRSECLVLWLGVRSARGVEVDEALVPTQVAAIDYFRLPRESILEILDLLRSRGGFIAAQVHSHPEEAFHSAADDAWAIVRHVGALSLVLPRFAIDTSPENFLENVAVFSLSPSNKWEQVPQGQVAATIRVIA